MRVPKTHPLSALARSANMFFPALTARISSILFICPKGLRLPAQGCGEAATLGYRVPNNTTPTGLCQVQSRAGNKPNKALPVLAYPVNSIRRCALLPQGATYISPGLRRSYPGSARATRATLKGLRHCFPRPPLRNPVGVGSLCVPFPE